MSSRDVGGQRVTGKWPHLTLLRARERIPITLDRTPFTTAKQGSHLSRGTRHYSSPALTLLPLGKSLFSPVFHATLFPSSQLSFSNRWLPQKTFEAWIPSSLLPLYSEMCHEEQQLTFGNPTRLCVTTTSHSLKFFHTCAPDVNKLMTICHARRHQNFLVTHSPP